MILFIKYKCCKIFKLSHKSTSFHSGAEYKFVQLKLETLSKGSFPKLIYFKRKLQN